MRSPRSNRQSLGANPQPYNDGLPPVVHSARGNQPATLGPGASPGALKTTRDQATSDGRDVRPSHYLQGVQPAPGTMDTTGALSERLWRPPAMRGSRPSVAPRWRSGDYSISSVATLSCLQSAASTGGMFVRRAAASEFTRIAVPATLTIRIHTCH